VVLLGLSFLSRLSLGQAGISIAVRTVGYGFPPSTVFHAMAWFLSFFAAIYSRWPLSLNNRAAVWHYWITAAAIAAFWFCFHFFAFHAPRESDLTVRQTAACTWALYFDDGNLARTDDLRRQPGVRGRPVSEFQR
jgi:hypothetical protein